MSFYNTIRLSGDALNEASEKAQSQDMAVMEFFKARPNQLFTPCDVWKALVDAGVISQKVPLTSIRRTINTLTNENKLTKTNIKRPGFYGSPNYTWVYKAEAKVLSLF